MPKYWHNFKILSNVLLSSAFANNNKEVFVRTWNFARFKGKVGIKNVRVKKYFGSTIVIIVVIFMSQYTK